MANIAFQNSLTGRDSERFTASLREGAVLEDKSYLQETLSNVVPSTKKLVSETYEMIKHPIQTAKSLYELGSGVVQLAIPGEQGNENVAKAAGQYFADRYGSLEKAKESLKNDPAGVLTEVLGIAAGGAGLSKAVVTGAVKATAPIITNIKKNKVVKIDPTPERKNIVESMPQNAETNSFTTYHGDSMLDTKGSSRSLDAEGLYVPQKSFNKNEPLSLAVDKSNAKSYASTITDKKGSSGFLYEVSIPKKVLNGLFDPFNKNHVDIFNKRINIMLKKGDAETSYDSINWSKVKNKDEYIKSAYTDPMQLKDVQGSASSNNWAILEQPDVVAALKKEGFTGTWQKEAPLASQRVKGTDGGYDQIQIFDGSSVDIITNNTKNIYRGTDGTYNMASFESFLGNTKGAKSQGVKTQTLEQFNKELKNSIDAGEDIIFNGKKIDLKDIDRNQGGITTEPWGGSNASLYPPPQKPEGAEPSSVQEQTEQVFNSTPRLNEGGTPTQGIDEIVVTGKKTGKSVNNPTSVLHPNYNTWQAGMSSYIPEEIVEGDYLNARLGGGKAEEGMEKYPDVDTTTVTAPSRDVFNMRERLAILYGNDDFKDVMEFDTANVMAIIKDKDLQSLIFDDLSEEEKLNTKARIFNKQDTDAALDIAKAENIKELFYQDEFDFIENRDSSMSKEGAVLQVVASFSPTDSTLSVDEKLANLNKVSEFLNVLEALDSDTYNKSLKYNINYKEGVLKSNDPSKISSINPLFNETTPIITQGFGLDKDISDSQISNIDTYSLKQINDDIKNINSYIDFYPDKKDIKVEKAYGDLLPVVNNLMLLNKTNMTI